MYAYVQQQQEQQRRQQQQQQQEQQQPSPYWRPQPAVPAVPSVPPAARSYPATPTFHNNSALAAHSPMARFQASQHAQGLFGHPWSAHPPATPAPSLPPSLHRQRAPSPAMLTQSPWRPSLAPPLPPQSLTRAPDSLLHPTSPNLTRILVPVRPSIQPPAVVAENRTPLIPPNPMTKAAVGSPARQQPQPSPYQRWVPPPQTSPTSDQDYTTNKALWLPSPRFNSVNNRQLVHLNSDSSDDSDDTLDSPDLSDPQALHAIVGPLSVSLPSKSPMSTHLLERGNIWRTPEATCDPPPRYQANPAATDGSPPSRIPVPIRNPKPTPLSQSTPAPPFKSSTAANTPRSTATPSAARFNAFKSPNNTLKSPATTIRLPVIRGTIMKEKPPLPLPKNLANTPSSTAARTPLRPQPEKTRATTTSGGRATPARPVIGLDLSLNGRNARKNSLSTPRSPRSPIVKSSSGASPSNKRAGASATTGRKSRSSSISSRRASVSSSSPRVTRKSSPVPPLPTKATATAASTPAEPTPATRAATRASPAAAPAPLAPTMTPAQLDALPEIIVDEEAIVSEVLPLPPPTQATPPPASASATTPSASPRRPPGDVKPLMVTLPSQAKNKTTVKIVKETPLDPPLQPQPQPQPQPQAQPERSQQPSPKVAPKPVPTVDAGVDSVQAKIRAYNERDDIRKRTLSIVPPPQREREKEEEEEVMEIEARDIPQARRHSVDSNIDFRPHGVPGQPLQLTYPGYPVPYAPRTTDPSPRRQPPPMQPIDEPSASQMQMVQAQVPIYERRRMSNSTGAPSVMTKSSSGSSRFGTEYSIPEARNRHSRGSSNASGRVPPPQMASLASPEVMDVSLVGPFTPPQPFVPSVDDRPHRRRAGKRGPPPTHADPHARLIANDYDAPRGRQMSSHHNRNPSPAYAPESPTVPSNAPLLAPRPQPLEVAIYEPQKLVKQNSSSGSSSSGSSFQVHQVPRRNRRSIPPPQPIPVPGAPDYSQGAPPPQPQAHQQMHDAPMTMTSYGSAMASLPSQQVAPSPYHHTAPYPQMYNHSYPSAPPLPPNGPVFGSPAPGPQMAPQGPRDFANPSHFRNRPKVLTVPAPLGPQMQGNGYTPSSSTAGSVMMMSPPYQTQQLAATTLPGSYSPVPPHPSASPYQGHWKPYTPEPLPPSQLYPQQQMQPVLPPPQQQQQQQQQQGRQRGHQPTRSEPPRIEFPPPLPDKHSPTTQDGYYSDARRANAEMQVNSISGRGRDLLQPPPSVPPPIQAKPPPPSQRGHAKSMSESGPGKMNASTLARMLQAQRGNPANASSTSLNNLPAPASSTSLVQQHVPEERTNTHRPDSPVKPAPPAPIDHTRGLPAPPPAQAQPSAQRRVLRRETPPPPPPHTASAPILIRSNSPAGPGLSPAQKSSRGFASSDALLEGNNKSNNSSSTNVSALPSTPTGPTGRKISFDVPHGPEQDPPAAAAAPKKRRRGRPTNPEDNMFVDPFGFPVAEDTRYDVVEKVAAEKKKVQGEPQFPAYRENYTAKTNALRAQEEAEMRERERQEASKLRRGGSPLFRRNSPSRGSPSRGSPRASPEPGAHRNRDAGPRDPHLRLYQNEPMSYSQQQLPPQQQPSRPTLGRLGRSSSADSTHNKLRKPRDRSQSPSGYLLLRKPQLPPQLPPQPQDMRGGSPSGYLHDHPYRPAPGQYSTQSPGRIDAANAANVLRGKLTKRR